MKVRVIATGVILTLFFAIIIAIFWYQEHRYLMPSFFPANYTPVLPGKEVQLSANSTNALAKPVRLHFFNPDCPCSRFNI